MTGRGHRRVRVVLGLVVTAGIVEADIGAADTGVVVVRLLEDSTARQLPVADHEVIHSVAVVAALFVVAIDRDN